MIEAGDISRELVPSIIGPMEGNGFKPPAIARVVADVMFWFIVPAPPIAWLILPIPVTNWSICPAPSTISTIVPTPITLFSIVGTEKVGRIPSTIGPFAEDNTTLDIPAVRPIWKEYFLP